MPRIHHVLDRAVPDLLRSEDLPDAVAVEVDHLAGRPDRWMGAGDAEPVFAARAMVTAGRVDEAAELASRWTTAQMSDWSAQAVVGAVWVVSRVGPRSALAPLADLVDGLEGPRVLDDGIVVDRGLPLGPIDTVRGLLAAAAGRAEEAVACLEAGVVGGDRRAPVWGAIARLELARVLRGIPEPRIDDADELLFATRLFFRSGGYHHLAAVTERLVVHDAVPAAPGVAHLVPGVDWRIGFGVQVPVDVPASKGLVALHALVRQPGRPIPVVALDRIVDGRDVPDDLWLPAGLGPRELDDGDLEADLRRRFVDDRIRSRVTKLVRRTVDRLGDEHRFLGQHLRAAVRTGYVCRYVPEHEVRWRT